MGSGLAFQQGRRGGGPSTGEVEEVEEVPSDQTKKEVGGRRSEIGGRRSEVAVPCSQFQLVRESLARGRKSGRGGALAGFGGEPGAVWGALGQEVEKFLNFRRIVRPSR